MLYDISQEVFSCRVYPGDESPVLRRVTSMAEGGTYNLTAFSMCAHNGTHVDAPFHFLPEGAGVDALGLTPFVGRCRLVRHRGTVTAADAARMLAQAGGCRRLLMAGPAGITEESAAVLAEGKLLLLGVESQSVGPEEAPAAVHRRLLGAGTALLEGAVLTDVPEGEYFLSAAPLNLAGCDGAPCRAWLMDISDL